MAAARELRGVTQGELAVLLRGEGLTVDAADVSRIETGKIQTPSIERLRALARVLNVTGDYLLGLDPPEEAAGDATPPGPAPNGGPGGRPLDAIAPRRHRDEHQAG